MAVVERVIGGAGTGKTKLILDSMCDIRSQYGLGPEPIGFSTFTRMARQEMTDRAAERWGVSESRLNRDGYFRTAHSLCLKQLKIGRDQLLADDVESREWIAKKVGIELRVRIDEAGNPYYEPLGKNDSEGAAALTAWQLARRTLTPVREWIRARQERGEPVVSWEAVNQIVPRYETAKRVMGRLDFDDLLARFAGVSFNEDGLRRVVPSGELPDEVEAWFLDECQDSTALMDLVFRRLADGPNVRYCLLAADPYQALFSYAGASSSHFLAWPGTETVMPRSYRCPPVVMALGERCLKQMHRGYRDRGIAPASHDGSVVQAGGPSDAILEHVSADQSCLILARCSYSLAPYAARLREAGIPFSDLKNAPDSCFVGFRAIWSLGHGDPVVGSHWREAALVFQVSDHGMVKKDKDLWVNDAHPFWDVILPSDSYLAAIGCTPGLVAEIRSGRWTQRIIESHRQRADDWLDLAKRHGPDLATEPRVKIGTIHAAKGAQADTVILSTQTSKAIEAGRRKSEDVHDDECRVAYVAVTRAKKKLVVVEDGRRHRMNLPL